jgi:fibronectin type 3 domain-containing protein
MRTIKAMLFALGVMFMTACPPASASHSAKVAWHAGATYPTTIRFRVYRSTNGASYTMMWQSPAVNAGDWTDTSVVAGTKYWYYVTTYDVTSTLESPKSNVVTCTIPTP